MIIGCVICDLRRVLDLNQFQPAGGTCMAYRYSNVGNLVEPQIAVHLSSISVSLARIMKFTAVHEIVLYMLELCSRAL